MRRLCGEGSRALTWGDLALRLLCEAAAKPKADHSGSEKSAEVVVAGASRKAGKARGRTEREGRLRDMTLGNAWHQMPGKSQGGLGRTLAGRGEAASESVSDEAGPARHAQTDWGADDLLGQALARENMGSPGSPKILLTSTSRTARCGPACRVVWEGPDQR